MAEVDGNTLMMAIQAVDIEISLLIEELKSEDPNPDDHELYMSYWKAAMKLKEAYLAEAKQVSNLPPYEKLVKNS